MTSWPPRRFPAGSLLPLVCWSNCTAPAAARPLRLLASPTLAARRWWPENRSLRVLLPRWTRPWGCTPCGRLVGEPDAASVGVRMSLWPRLQNCLDVTAPDRLAAGPGWACQTPRRFDRRWVTGFLERRAGPGCRRPPPSSRGIARAGPEPPGTRARTAVRRRARLPTPGEGWGPQSPPFLYSLAGATATPPGAAPTRLPQGLTTISSACGVTAG